MKALSADSFLARLLGKLAVMICRHPRWFVWPQVIFFFVSLVVTFGYLQFDTDRNNLVSGNQLYHHNFREFQKEFPQPDDLVVVVESENIEKNRQFVARLGARLATETNLFTDVLFQKDIALMGNKGLQMAKTSELVEMKDQFSLYLPFVRQFTAATNLVSFFDLINTQFRTAKRETNAQNDSLVKALPALEGILRQARDSLDHSGTPPPPSIAALFGGSESDVASNYITFANGRLFILTTHAPNEAASSTPPVLGALIRDAIKENVFHQHTTSGDLTADAIERLRVLINETKREITGVNVGLIGEPVLDNDEMTQSQKDTTVAGIVSLVLCAIIFIYGYNETGRPLKAIICLLIGLAYTLAFATLTVGHLNVLTITFLPMLIGLAIDFGVHLITRYEEELRHGKTAEEALHKAMVFTGQGIITGALTTAGAFAAMAFTDFKGIREMGIICGGGLMVCLVPMLTLLPVLLMRGKQNVMDHKVQEDEKRARIENLWLSRPVLVTVIIIVTCGLAAMQLRKVSFDYNLLNMQSAGLPAVVYEQKLIDSADKSVLFCAVVADNLTEAVRLEKQIRTLTNVVADVESMAGFLDQDQKQKLGLISEIKGLVAPLHFPPADEHPVDIYELSRTMLSLKGYVGLAREEVGTNDPALTEQFASLQTTIQDFRKAMLAGDSLALTAHAETLGQFQQGLFEDLSNTFEVIKHQNDQTELRMQDLPAVLRHRFIGEHGKFMLQVYPRKNVWQRENQKEFVDTLRANLDPQGSNHPIITGTPVQLLEYTSQLKDSYITAAWYSLIAIAIMVFFHFRSLTAVILALIPVAIGTLWLIGMMGWQGVPFNPANIMTLPLVIGIGVTNGIHILNRYAEERTPGILARSTGKAVLVSGLTAIAGFGSLILAKHRGIHSLGFIMSVGIATCMLAGLTFLPALLNLISRWRPLIKKPSVGRTSPTPGQEEPR